MADVICLGELLIDFVPTQTGVNLREVPGFNKLPGGAPANVVVGLKRFGVDSAFMGKVGDDAFGHFLAATLQLAGIDIDNLLFSDEARTALAFIALDADGERDFMFYCHPSADMLFRPEEVDADAIGAAKLVHFGSLSLRPAPVRAATLHALDLAQQAGCLISYDPNLRLSLWADADAAREGLLSGLARAHIVKMSEDEVSFLSDGENLDAAIADLWHPDLQLLVVTRGNRGCRYFIPDSSGNVETFQVTAVDTTGAGDGFVAGLLQGIVKDPSTLGDEQKLKDLCRFANAAGALTTTSYGAIPALPDLQQVARILDENG
jgi:fructokinase